MSSSHCGTSIPFLRFHETKLNRLLCRQPVRSGDRLLQLLADPKSRPQVATFTSSSTVHHFVRASRGASLDGLALASIGPITSATLRSYGLHPAIEAESYTMAGLARAIVKWAQEQNQGLAAG